MKIRVLAMFLFLWGTFIFHSYVFPASYRNVETGVNDGSNFANRFRHLATKVHFKSKRDNARKSPSPERLAALEEDKLSDKSDKSSKSISLQNQKKLSAISQNVQSK